MRGRAFSAVIALFVSAMGSVGAPPTTKPVDVAAAPPAERRMHWYAKEDAPDSVRQFLSTLPARKASVLGKMHGDLDRMKNEIERLKLQRTEASKRKPGTVRSTNSGGYQTNQADVAAQQREIRTLGEKINQLWKDVRAKEEQMKQFEADPLWLPEPGLRPEVGSFGPLGRVRVFEVVDAKNLIVDCQALDKSIWLKDVETEGVVDDQQLVIDNTYMITGTKGYRTAIGGKRTVFLAERFELRDHIEARPED